MARCGSCSGRRKSPHKYVWTSENGEQTTTYNTEIEAKAKVRRKGGSYEPVKV